MDYLREISGMKIDIGHFTISGRSAAMDCPFCKTRIPANYSHRCDIKDGEWAETYTRKQKPAKKPAKAPR